MRWAWGLAVVLGCGASPMGKIERLRDALVDGARIEDAELGPRCAEQPAVVVSGEKAGPYDAGCLGEIANAYGSKQGFSGDNFDHASAAAAATVLLREGRGDFLAHADRWLRDVKSVKGAGHDVLRLAIARKMDLGAADVGKVIADDAAARAALRAIVGAIPGACPTYWLVATGARMAPELDPDHAACVQLDLARREGPGVRYGAGTMRALEGALALWRETERSLRLGLTLMDGGGKATLGNALGRIEPATQRIATRKVDSPAAENAAFLGSVHADAGVPIFTLDGSASPR